jgi:hypothetical protein
MRGSGTIFVLIFFGGITWLFARSALDTTFKKGKIKLSKGAIDYERRHRTPEEFEKWLASEQKRADESRSEDLDQIGIWIAVPVGLILASLVVAWIYS